MNGLSYARNVLFAGIGLCCATAFSDAATPELRPAESCSCPSTPFAISFAPGFEAPGEDWDVFGIRLNIFAGRHHDVAFLDLGTVANLASGEACGLQVAGIYNQVDSSEGIFQAAFVANYCRNSLSGVQVSAVNVAGTVCGGVQAGVFNRAEALTGLQIGVVNYTHQAEGIQIGLLNIIADSPCAVMPIVNIGF